MTLDISVVIPVYNEEEGIAAAIDRIGASLQALQLSFEIIVVNDGSKDKTLSIIENIAKEKWPQVKVLSHYPNQGAVQALLRGFSEAKGDIVTHNAADLAFDPDDIRYVLEAIKRQNADVVVVERKDRNAYGPIRKTISWTNVIVLKCLFQSPVFDHNFVQAYRRHVLRSIDVTTRGFSTVTAELILKAAKKNYKITSIQCEYHERRIGTSSIRFKHITEAIYQLYQLKRTLNEGT